MQYNYTITCIYAYNTTLKYCITTEEYVCTYVYVRMYLRTIQCVVYMCVCIDVNQVTDYK